MADRKKGYIQKLTIQNQKRYKKENKDFTTIRTTITFKTWVHQGSECIYSAEC
jgi:hypothetical protein